MAFMRVPRGTDMARGKRGSLVVAITEALSGEAPKGQPMIHGETIKVVCVEDPKGQPRNHKRHPRQVRKDQQGKGRKEVKDRRLIIIMAEENGHEIT